MHPLNVLMLIAAGLASITSFLITVAALFPNPVNKMRSTLEESQGRSFLIGLVNTLFLIAVLAGIFFLIKRTALEPIAVITGLLLIGFFLVGVSAGLAGTMQLLARRLSPESVQPRAQVRAGVLLILASVLPYIGWFLFVPYMVLTSFGSFMTVFFRYFRSEKGQTPVQDE